MTQCLPEMKDKLEAQSTELEKLEDDNDVIRLLDHWAVRHDKGTRPQCWWCQEQVCYHTVAEQHFVWQRQHAGPNESLNEYGKRFLQQGEVQKLCGESLFPLVTTMAMQRIRSLLATNALQVYSLEGQIRPTTR